MSSLAVIADASALIALNDIGLLERLAPLFATCLIPPAVAREIAPSVTRPEWIIVQSLTRPIAPLVLGASLGPGETEVIGLALELGGHQVLLDDRAARRLAGSLNLPVIGTLGLLVLAKRAGLLASIRASVDALLAADFYVSPRLVERALHQAGESPGDER